MLFRSQTFAGWIPQDGLFGRSASAGLRKRAWRRGVNPVAARPNAETTPGAAASSSSWSGCIGAWISETAAARWARPRKGCSSVQATPTSAWQESTWSTRSPASMNDVDTTEHWQTMGRAGTAPGWVQACSWSRRVLTNLLAQALGSAVHDGQGAAPAGQLAGNRDVGDHEVLLTLSEAAR